MLSIRNKARFMSVFTILAMLFSFANVSPAAAQQPAPQDPPGWTQGTDTHFALPNSPYLPVTLDSSFPVTLTLSSVPEVVDLMISADPVVGSAEFTVSGFAANTLYYHYADEGLNPVTFTTDANGSFTYTQDLSESHHVWFRDRPSTYHLYDNATGGDCTSFGTWSLATKTCTLTGDNSQTIFIEANGITLDGNGFSSLSSDNYYAVYSWGYSNVTIKNLNVSGSSYGIIVGAGNNIAVTNNTVSGGYYGILAEIDSSNLSVTNNTITNSAYYGIYILGENNSTIRGNTISNAYYGGVYIDGYFTSYDYWYYGYHYVGSYGYSSTNNTVYQNIFVNTNTPIYLANWASPAYTSYFDYGYYYGWYYYDTTGNVGNVFNLAAPDGGNYYSQFDESAEGCNNTNSDSFCDSAFGGGGGAVDNLPWTTQDGWATPTDATAPVITYTITPSTPDGANGWYKSSVTLAWSVTDPESAVTMTGCVDQNITADQLATPYACSATSTGGSSGPVSVTIQRDATPPTDVNGAAARLPDHNGWYNTPVGVMFSGQDATSGIASCTSATFSGPDNAASSAAGSCTDNAGNTANGSLALMYDASGPSASLSAVGTLGNNGWYVSDVTVQTSGSDSVSNPTACTADQFQTTDTPGAAFNGSCANDAGLTMNATPLTVKVDKTLPTILAAATTAPNGAGWYNSNVTVHFTCDDGTGSGIVSCPADQVLSAEGAAVASTAQTVSDAAGNTSAPSNVVTVKIDKTKPTLSPAVSPNPVILNGTATVTSGAADALSGLASQSCGTLVTNSVGSKSVTCTATDNAGNTNSATVTYKVIYRFDGFLQPINDTAHTTYCGNPCVASIFKGGSTVPVKFQLKDANGNVVQTATLPVWLTPVKGGSTSAAIDESVYSDPATSGNTYKWDGQQYHYNWKTTGFTAGFFWRIGVTLDDGQTYYVYIGLR